MKVVRLEDALKELEILLQNQKIKWKDIYLNEDKMSSNKLSVVQLLSILDREYGFDPSLSLPVLRSLDVEKSGLISLD